MKNTNYSGTQEREDLRNKNFFQKILYYNKKSDDLWRKFVLVVWTLVIIYIIVAGISYIFLTISFLILLSAYRNPITRKIGFRNISRRIDNTIMVIIGSMVGAALISGSLVLSDSLNATFKNLVKDNQGELDLMVLIEPKKLFDTPVAYIDQQEFDQIKTNLNTEKIDGVMGLHLLNTAPQRLKENGDPDYNVYNIDFLAIDFDQYNQFGENPIHYDKPSSPDNVYIAEALARKLELKVGDTIRVPYAGRQFDFKVEKIVPKEDFPGNPFIVADIHEVNKLIGLPKNSYSTVFVSTKGGVEPQDYKGEDFEKYVKDELNNFQSDNVKLTYFEVKQAALDGYGFSTFSNFFLAMSFFGIFAGMLLIVNLYMMLASERKYEMGILRAIALTRFQLMKSFIYEGYIYSVLSSLVGTIVGLGIGYFLIEVLKSLFGTIAELANLEDVFSFTFSFKIESLIVAFVFGGLITLFTVFFSSFRISRLNIVSAIRNLEEDKVKKYTWKWYILTILLVLLTFSSLAALVFYFQVDSYFDNLRMQADSSIAELSQAKFDELVGVTKVYSLYSGVVFSLIFGTFLFNRIVKRFFKKDFARVSISISSLAIVITTSLLSQFKPFLEVGESDYAVPIYFISGVVIVIAMSMLVVNNIDFIIAIVSFVLRPFRGLSSVVKIALRYPAVDKTRTGLTLIMFAIVIFLIVYTSMMKVTVNKVNETNLNETLGGYDVIVAPGFEANNNEVKKMVKTAEHVDNVEDVTQILHTSVIMPEYKYKDLDEGQVFDNPLFYQHEDEDYFKTTLDGLPADYIRDQNIKLEQRLDKYESDQAVWDDVISDPNKVVIGAAFTEDGYGSRPDLTVGDKIKVADIFDKEQSTKQIVGVIKTVPSGLGNFAFYDSLITTNKAIKDSYNADYVNHKSNSEILVKFNDNADVETSTKELKRGLINYSVAQIFELEQVAATAQGFFNGLILMFQAFMGFSLVVGASGLAIIVTRSVQERRQQIGMLRSLGFQKRMILLSFLIEATFITFLGIVIGISMGTVGALNEFAVVFKDQPEIKPVFAYAEVFIISGIVYLASILFSIIPSIKASNLSPVEATNYPE